jgi:DNA-binding MarR family transcriptional regulator
MPGDETAAAPASPPSSAWQGAAILSILLTISPMPGSLAGMNAAPAQVEELCWELRRGFRDLAAAAEVELRPLAITAGDRAILEFLAREPAPISLSDLARKTSVSRQHIHQSIRRLPDPRWVEEVRNPADRREVLLRPSRGGRAFWKKVRVVDRAFLARLAPEFRPDELRGALRTLRKLRTALRAKKEVEDEFDA